MLMALPEQPGHNLVEENFVDAQSALGSGYSESKWVCESILGAASKNTSLKPVVVRVGQLSGMSTSGCWNTKEWVPALFKSSIQLGCLPLIENVSALLKILPLNALTSATRMSRGYPLTSQPVRSVRCEMRITKFCTWRIRTQSRGRLSSQQRPKSWDFRLSHTRIGSRSSLGLQKV